VHGHQLGDLLPQRGVQHHHHGDGDDVRAAAVEPTTGSARAGPSSGARYAREAAEGVGAQEDGYEAAADLAGEEQLLQLSQRRKDAGRAGVALADVLLDSGAANGEEGELGGHQEGVDQHEAQHCEDA
jgi:hypothetical protein